MNRNEFVKKMLGLWRNCAARQVEQIDQWLAEPSSEEIIVDETNELQPDETVSQQEIVSSEEINTDVQPDDNWAAETSTQESTPSVSESTCSIKEMESICKQLAEMVKNYDQLSAQMPDGEAKDILMDMSEQIIASMNLGGCTAITKETAFNNLRHRTVPFACVEDSTPIISTLRAGVELNGRVLIKAIVKL